MTPAFDILILGAGAAGMPAAIFASHHGVNVLVVETADRIGGSFHLSNGIMSAAGTRLQAAKGIHDTPQMHYDDIMCISDGTANPEIVRLAVDNAADTLHWLLDNGFKALPDHPVTAWFHEPYSVPRMYWAENGGKAVLDTMAPLYTNAEKSGRIETWLDSRLLSLTGDAQGAVTGARIRRGDKEVQAFASAVVLATGGYTANAELFTQLSAGRPRWGGGWPHGRGDGLLAAVAAGSEIVNSDKFLPGFAGVEDPQANGGYTPATHTIPQDRQPWEIYVDSQGHRFVREDDPSIDVRERALFALPDMTFWAIYDEAILAQAPPFFTISRDAAAIRFDALPGYQKAETIEALAGKMEIDPATLARTINAFNAAIIEGKPDPAGREHRPLPITEAPFYAVRHVGWSITSFAGVKIDGALRVLNAAGQPIPNLYAAGEIVGLGSTCGNAFAGGMSVTPAMTFGRLLGTRLAKALILDAGDA
jgi:fumarate reductase flavoprotein subunit